MTQSSTKLRLKKLGLALPLTVAGVLAVSSSAQATLYNRGGGLIFDDILNVTWLQDANYAKTSGYDADGKMTWNAASTWAANLVYNDTVRGTTWSDWRLASATDLGTLGPDNTNSTYNGDAGFNVNTSTSELAHLYYDALGLKSPWTTSGAFAGDIYGLWGNGSFNGTNRLTRTQNNVGPFTNIQADNYWLGTSYAGTAAFAINLSNGYQAGAGMSTLMFAWAVRPGDVGTAPAPVVPVPGAAWLLASGLIGMLSLNRSKRSA